VKVFGIGLSKTGTTSLARALEILDYKVKDCIGVKHYAKGDISSIDLSIIDNNNAFTDTPIPSFYKELDEKYSESKFILTIRDKEAWLKSCRKQFNQKQAEKQTEAHNQLFFDIYNSTVFDEKKFLNGYDKHINEIKEDGGNISENITSTRTNITNKNTPNVSPGNNAFIRSIIFVEIVR